MLYINMCLSLLAHELRELFGSRFNEGIPDEGTLNVRAYGDCSRKTNIDIRVEDDGWHIEIVACYLIKLEQLTEVAGKLRNDDTINVRHDRIRVRRKYAANIGCPAKRGDGWIKSVAEDIFNAANSL